MVFGGCAEIQGQGKEDETKFIGSWFNTTAYPALIQFFSEGTCVYGGESGTWSVKNNKLTIQLPDLAITYSYNYEFSNNDQTLLLSKTFGYSILYTKQ